MSTSSLNSSSLNYSTLKVWDEVDVKQSVAYWVIKIVIAVATIVGNGLVIFLITSRRKLHTTDNWFILSLSLSDLFTGVYITPSELLCDVFKVCIKSEILRTVIPNYFIIASICNLLALTIDRYIAILYPLRYVALITSSRVKQIIFIAWFIPLLIVIAMMLPIMSPRFVAVDRYLTILWIILITFVPSIVLILIYFRIYIIVKMHQKQTVRQRHVSAVSMDSARDQQRSKDSSSIKVLGVVILFFVLCWQPSVYRAICEDITLCCVPHSVKLIARLLIMLNSAINFVVYALFKKDIRKELFMFCKSVVVERKQSTASGRSGSSALSATSVRYWNQISSSRQNLISFFTASSRTINNVEITEIENTQ